MNSDSKFYSSPSDHMLTVGLGLSIFYWLCEFCIGMLSAQHGSVMIQLFGKSIDDVWTRIVVLCLFMIFGSHAQYTIDKRKQAEYKLRRQNEYMEALHETTVGLIQRLDLNELLQAIINRAATLTRIPHGFIYLYDSNTNDLELKVGTGLFKNYTGLRLKPGEGISGQVWIRGESIVINNYQNWSGRSPHFSSDAIQCIMAVPLKSEKSTDGVIGLCYTETDKLINSESAEMLERFSRLASVAIYNARLYTDMQHELERRRQAEDEAKKMEAQLRRSQKMEALGTIAGGIAHDFNNILSGIIGFSEIALYEIDKDSKIYRNLSQVVNAALRAKDLVRQILTFSRESCREKKIIQITLAVKESLHLIKASLPANIKIDREISDHIGYILANPTEIHQVLMNLCTNAIHAMEEKGGILKVSLSNIAIRENGSSERHYVRLNVRDTGVGISPEVMEKIFDPYFTTKTPDKGTGLGLAIVHRIVQSHNGVIRINSKLDEGTDIEILFPMVEKYVHPDTGNLEAPATGKGHILFVDDEELLAEVGKHLLEKLGYSVVTFQYPPHALEHFTSQPQAFDAIITDMDMPEMNGVQLIREILKIRQIPVIITTGFSENISREDAAKLGVSELLMKPLTLHDLAASVQKAIKKNHS